MVVVGGCDREREEQHVSATQVWKGRVVGGECVAAAAAAGRRVSDNTRQQRRRQRSSTQRLANKHTGVIKGLCVAGNRPVHAYQLLAAGVARAAGHTHHQQQWRRRQLSGCAVPNKSPASNCAAPAAVCRC